MPQLWLILNTEHQASGNVERPSTIDTNTPPVCETLEEEEEEAAAANSTAPTNGQLCARCELRVALSALHVASCQLACLCLLVLPIACCPVVARYLLQACLTFSTVDGPATTLQMGEIV